MTDSIASRTYATAFATPENGRCAIQYEIKIWTAALLLSGILSAGAGVCGSLVAIVCWLEPEAVGSAEPAIGLVLNALLFPLLFSTAHCMDRLGQARRRMKWAEYPMDGGCSRVTR